METPEQPTPPQPAARPHASPAPAQPAPAGPSPAAQGSRMPWGVLIALIWLIPLALLALRVFLLGGGWETLFLLMSAPIWYPILGVLGMMPRWTWRKRAGKQADPPHSVVPGFIIHWSGLLLMAIAVRGVGDSGSVASALGRWFPFFEERGEAVVAGIGLVCAIVGLIIAITIAGSQDPAVTGRRNIWLTLAAWLVIPLALALGLAGQLISMSSGGSDASGRTELQASRLSVAEAGEAEQGYWDDLQRAILPAREALAADGWQLQGGGSGIVDASRNDKHVVARTVWEARSTASGEELAERVRAELRRGGWRPDPEGAREQSWTEPSDPHTTTTDVAFERNDPQAADGNTIMLWSRDDAGNHLGVRFWVVEQTGATGVEVLATGPEQWASQSLSWREPELAALGGSGKYEPSLAGMRADEWPALGPVERGSLTFVLHGPLFPGEGEE